MKKESHLQVTTAYIFMDQMAQVKHILLTQWLIDFASRGISSAYIKLNDLFTYLKNKMSNSISLNEIKSSLKNVSLLVIDDLGFEKHNEWFKYDFVYEILQYRNANNKFTVLCSLLEPKELANYYRNIETDKRLCVQGWVINLWVNWEFYAL